MKIPIITLRRIKITTEYPAWNSGRSCVHFGRETGYADLCFAKLTKLREVALLYAKDGYRNLPPTKIWEMITLQHGFMYQTLLLIMKEDRQWMYNIILRRNCSTIVVMEKQWILHKMCVFLTLGMPRLCDLLSCVACPSLYKLSHKQHDFRKILLTIKCVFWFSLQHLSEKVFIPRRNERDVIKKYILVFMYSTLYSCPILMKLNFLDRFSKNTEI